MLFLFGMLLGLLAPMAPAWAASEPSLHSAPDTREAVPPPSAAVAGLAAEHPAERATKLRADPPLPATAPTPRPARDLPLAALSTSLPPAPTHDLAHGFVATGPPA